MRMFWEGLKLFLALDNITLYIGELLYKNYWDWSPGPLMERHLLPDVVGSDKMTETGAKVKVENKVRALLRDI